MTKNQEENIFSYYLNCVQRTGLICNLNDNVCLKPRYYPCPKMEENRNEKHE